MRAAAVAAAVAESGRMVAARLEHVVRRLPHAGMNSVRPGTAHLGDWRGPRSGARAHQAQTPPDRRAAP
ncbi:hypothetical protein I541_5662 [Mycobacteroides abscessus]|nr:hypothetical protein I541_5662 [Mycobacteroides abscessus]